MTLIRSRTKWIASIVRVHCDLTEDYNPFAILDLCRSTNPQYVLITKDNWQLVDSYSLDFHRPPNLYPLPIPEYPGDLDLLKTLIRVDDQVFETIKCWLVSAIYRYYMIRRDKKSLLVINGESSKQKKLIMKVLKNLLDPCYSFDDRFPVRPKKLIEDCESNYILTYTLTDKISLEKSAANFFTYLTSDLFTPITVYCYYRPILTTVNLACYRPVIVVNNSKNLKRPIFHDFELHIDVKESKEQEPEEEVLKRLEDLKPKILGGLLSLVASVIKY